MFFSVATDRTETYFEGAVVNFHDILSSVGPSGWNSDTNKFSCPLTGFYQFIVTLYKDDSGGSTYNYNHLAYLMVGSTVTVRLWNRRDSAVGGIV